MLRQEQVAGFTSVAKNSKLYIEIDWKAIFLDQNIQNPYNSAIQVTQVYIPQYIIRGYGLLDNPYGVRKLEQSTNVYLYPQRWFLGHILGNDSNMNMTTTSTRIQQLGAAYNPTIKSLIEVEMNFSQIKFNNHVTISDSYFFSSVTYKRNH